MGLEVILKGVSKKFGINEFSLKNINLKISSGDTVALVGDSGCGKSTLLNIIAGIDRPQSGSVVIGGKDFGVMTEESLAKFRRNNLGFVFQSFQLIPHLNVYQNIIFPCLLLNSDLQRTKLKVKKFMSNMELDGREKAFPEQLSGGEQQRVAIARALIHEPKLILADEPTGNLDSVTTEKILNLLIAQCNSSGATLLMVTHSEQASKKMSRQIMLNFRGLNESNFKDGTNKTNKK